MDISSPKSVVVEYEAFINSIPPEGTPAWDKFLEELYDCSNIMDPSPTTSSFSESTASREEEKNYLTTQVASSVACNRYTYGPHALDTQDIVLKAMELMDLVIKQDATVKKLEEEIRVVKCKSRINI